METEGLQYPAHFDADEKVGGFVVTFRDVPEAITQGDDEDEAVMMAEDALATALEFYIERGAPFPPPSAALPGERMITSRFHGYDDEDDDEI